MGLTDFCRLSLLHNFPIDVSKVYVDAIDMKRLSVDFSSFYRHVFNCACLFSSHDDLRNPANLHLG